MVALYQEQAVTTQKNKEITHIINDRGMQGQCRGCHFCSTGGPGGWVCTATLAQQGLLKCLGKKYHYNDLAFEKSRAK